MKRRTVLGLLSAAPAWPLSAEGQQESRGRRLPRIGFVEFAAASVGRQTLVPFREGLRALGYVEGSTIVVESRDARGDVERGHALIDELAALPVDVFVSPGPAASRAIVRKTRIPVVAVALPPGGSEPELFASIARPGGTVTGFSAYGEEMSAKRLELLKEILPTLKTVGVMHNATDPTFSAWGTQTLADARIHPAMTHGDFAPWNLRTHHGRISAFDWEYGELDGLPLADEAHFTLQLGFQMQNWTPQQAHKALMNIAVSRPLRLNYDQVNAIHAVYLLDQIVRLLGEGYDIGHDMVSWYRQVLAKIDAPRREAVMA